MPDMPDVVYCKKCGKPYSFIGMGISKNCECPEGSDLDDYENMGQTDGYRLYVWDEEPALNLNMMKRDY